MAVREHRFGRSLTATAGARGAADIACLGPPALASRRQIGLPQDALTTAPPSAFAHGIVVVTVVVVELSCGSSRSARPSSVPRTYYAIETMMT
jgi:hypothetical protein